jgi:hypothetical protein
MCENRVFIMILGYALYTLFGRLLQRLCIAPLALCIHKSNTLDGGLLAFLADHQLTTCHWCVTYVRAAKGQEEYYRPIIKGRWLRTLLAKDKYLSKDQ